MTPLSSSFLSIESAMAQMVDVVGVVVYVGPADCNLLHPYGTIEQGCQVSSLLFPLIL